MAEKPTYEKLEKRIQELEQESIRRQHIEKELTASEEQYSISFNNANDLIQSISPTGKILSVNKKWLTTLEYSQEDTKNLRVTDIIRKDKIPQISGLLKKIARGESAIFETVFISKSGKEINVEGNGKGVFKEGKFISTVGIFRDITDRKKIGNELRENEAKFRQLFNEMKDGLAVYEAVDGGKDFVFRDINAAGERIGNVKKSEIIGKSLYEIRPNIDEFGLVDVLRSVWQTGNAEHHSERFYEDEKLQGWFDNYIYKLKNGNVVALFADNTARMRAENMLAESEEQFRTLVANIPGVVYRCKVDENWTMKFIGNEIETLTGYPAADFINNQKRSYASILHPEDTKVTDKIALEAVDQKKSFTIEYRIMCSDGKWHWAQERGRGIFDDQEKIVYLDGVIFDITKRKQMEETLKENEQRFRTVADFAYDWEYWVRPDGSYVHISPSCKRITGYDPDDFTSNPELMTEMIHPDDKAIFTKHMHTVDELGEIVPIEFRIITKNGDKRWIEHVCKAIYDTEGRHLGQRGSNRDISEKKKLQEEVSKIQKLESLGALAGGIAHDFNNLLFVVMGNISLAQDDLKPEVETSESLKAAQKACIKAKELTTQLITFSKGGDPVKKMMSVDDFLKDAVVSALSGSNIKPEIFIPDDIRQVNIDEGQIKQVIRNIVINAKEAMDDNGELTVSCKNIKIGKKGSLPLTYGEYIKISFKDQGCGISKENLKKIFEPYFSTKDMGADKGQGLGLTVSYSIIKKHGGLITVESELRKGSIVSVYLPAFRVKEPDFQKSKEKPAAQEPVKHPVTGTGKILLMDDEETIRIFMGMVINRLGYNVETCTEGKEAVEIYKKAMESKEAFDVAILDLTNKVGMGGQETMRRLLEIDDTARGIVITGYSDDPVVANFRSYGFSGSLTKPATRDELRKVINKVLSKGQ